MRLLFRIKDGIAMSKYNKIYVKIQVEKDRDSGDLNLKAYFDPEAPNFFCDKNEISWVPTHEEIEFINEAFELVPTSSYKPKDKQSKGKSKNKKNEDLPPLEEHEETENEPESFENEDKDIKEYDSDSPTDKKEVTEGIVETSDSGTIDRILRRKQDGYDDNFVEAGEDVIIDKVLKEKKKKKW